MTLYEDIKFYWLYRKNCGNFRKFFDDKTPKLIKRYVTQAIWIKKRKLSTHY